MVETESHWSGARGPVMTCPRCHAEAIERVKYEKARLRVSRKVHPLVTRARAAV